MYCNGIQSYRRTNVMTSDPMRLVIMCYEGAIDSLKLAKQKNDEKNYEAKGKAIIKAQDIIDELLCSLDIEKGGVIANNLSSLYNYMKRRIMHGDINRDTDALDEVIGMLSELLTAWKAVYLQQGQQVQGVADNLYGGNSAVASGYISA